MKIGILTFHRAFNYGALLQCFALSKYLRMKGCNVEIIDYFPTYFRKSYSLSPPNIFRGKIGIEQLAKLFEYFFTIRIKTRRYSSFKRFYKYLLLSKQQFNEKTLDLSAYDIVIWGSDQVWNPKLTHNDKNFIGDIKKYHNQRFVAYAVSTMLYHDHEEAEFYKTVLRNYDMISVREKSLNDYLNCLSNKSSQLVLDPVFLLNEQQWKSIAHKPNVKKRYLLLYTVPTHPRLKEITQKIAEEKCLEVIELAANVKMRSDFRCDYTASPLDFLGYFLHADYIVTTSFHGTAFSVIFRKQFVTVLLGSVVDERALNLLSSFGLDNRTISVNDSFESFKPDFDYQEIEEKIESLRNISRTFLLSIIK